MERTKIEQLGVETGQVRLMGWIHELREQSTVKFILLRDVTGIVQLVLPKDCPAFETELSRESVIEVVGAVQEASVKHEEVTQRGLEILVREVNVLSACEEELPIQVVKGKDEAGLSTRLDWRWIDLRKPHNLLTFRIWTCMEAAMREYWHQEGFIQIHSPKFMEAPSETGAELFEVGYFGKKAYLAQSPQFYKQMAMASGFEKVFEINPVFRANPSHTSRHDTEFTMVDVEISFVESHETVMEFEERWIQHTLRRVKEEFGEQIMETYGSEVVVPEVPFPRITMAQAQELLKEKGYKPGEDLDAEGERLISEIIREKYGHEFVFVTEYPWSVRPFYHMRKPGHPELTNSYDLIWNGLEITTGAQREHRYSILKSQAEEKGLHVEPIQHYLNFFRYGCPPHGGFGLSPSRMLMILLKLGNVREATFLPRDTERLNP